ncbi:MAG: AbrB/MazE/SpoVT family DNA-binding domain-containing protein [Stagnimonas sp.]|nr:AbrB/MazE/SpoVT family DNA-binding domain-containing protein [Stagnimonas sp.]
MLTAKLTDKGQLVIPKVIRDQLHLVKGSAFAVTLESGRVVLEPSRPSKAHRITDWPGFGRPLVKLTTAQLCADVEGYNDA